MRAEIETLMSGISALVKGTPRELCPFRQLCPFHSKKSPSVNQQQAFIRHGICQCLHLGLPSLRTMGKPVVHKPLVCSILLQQPRWTKRGVTSQRA